MVNWCPVSQTALSDEEVLMQMRQDKLYRIRYAIVEDPGNYVEVCTTRPETIGGDVAIAVHPKDLRHSHLLGKHVWRPFPKEVIPIVEDDAVLQDFGTGALKITPAHDPVDFAIGQRHGLPVVDVLNDDGTLNELAGSELAGLSREEAREKVTEILQRHSLLVSVEDYKHFVGISERAGVPIEPRLSEQWFLRYPQVEAAKEVLRRGLIRFFPPHWEKTYLHWLDHIQDWCISRQLLWGHRIPVWYPKGGDRSNCKDWHISVDGPPDPENWEQDEDVLDTWFSSAFWPMGIMGWPDKVSMKKNNFSFFYPTATLVTGPDIIFFWVARMIMTALEFLGEDEEESWEKSIPFRAVYFTGIIRDSQGRKMSKSLGNSPDPLQLIDRYGADGLRFGLFSMAPMGQDIFFDEERLEQGKRFCTKLWNACRFRFMQGERFSPEIKAEQVTAIDEAMVAGLMELCERVDVLLKNYEFHNCIQRLEYFFRTDYCDWYVEICKIRLNCDETVREHILAVQDILLKQLLQLLHPFIPFISDELWQSMGYGEEFLQNVPLATAAERSERLQKFSITISPKSVEMIRELRETIALLRSLKVSIVSGSDSSVAAYYGDGSKEDVIGEHSVILQKMVGFSSVEKRSSLQGFPAIVTPLGTFAIAIDGGLEKLKRQVEVLRKNVEANERKLRDEMFLRRAPAEIIQGARNLLAKNRKSLEKILELLYQSDAE
jgi:valyl-tRNA synthetase